MPLTNNIKRICLCIVLTLTSIILFIIGIISLTLFIQNDYYNVSANQQEITQQEQPDNSIDGSSIVSKSVPIGMTLPNAWILQDTDDIPAFTRVSILYVPDIEIVPHSNGVPIDDMNVDHDAPDYEQYSNAMHAASTARSSALRDALVVFNDGRILTVSTDAVMINMPDILPEAEYNAVYSYAAPSRCGGLDIPGLTGCRVDGYRDGKTRNDYLDADQFVMPVAYGTAVKTLQLEKDLAGSGYKLLFWDTYRPFSGSMFISKRFSDAYASSADIRNSTGGWALDWYAASGASGHNFGTDLDISLIDSVSGSPVVMPSQFDSFSSDAHLTVSQMSSSRISESAYTSNVLDNSACVELHRAAVRCGFSELASEWWHFGDDDTESRVSSVVGRNGCDFVADL